VMSRFADSGACRGRQPSGLTMAARPMLPVVLTGCLPRPPRSKNTSGRQSHWQHINNHAEKKFNTIIEKTVSHRQHAALLYSIL
jgi:hypothetical protein